MKPLHPPNLSLRVRLLFLVVACSMPMLGFEVWRTADERHEAVVAAERETLQLARTVAEREDDSLHEADNLLRVTVRMQAIATAGNGQCHTLVHEIVAEHLRLRDITVLRKASVSRSSGFSPIH